MPSTASVQNLGLLGITLLVALGLVEAGLRLVGYSVPVFHTLDPTLGWAFRPGAQGWQTREGRAWVRINRVGMRDSERTVAKPPGTYRIAVIGDSYVAGVEVPAESTFATRLGHLAGRCNRAGSRAVEVLNFGVPGYGTAQEYLVLRDLALRYHPDLVLLVVTPGNDIENNAPGLDGTPGRPFYHRTPTGLQLYLPTRSPLFLATWSVFGALVNHSRVLQLLHHTRSAYLTRGRRLGGLGHTVLAPPRNRAWAEAWGVTEALVLAVDSLTRAHGADLLVVATSSPIQVSPDTKEVSRIADSLGVPDLFYPDQRLLAFAARHDIPALALAPPMARLARERGAYFHGVGHTLGGGHWNEVGHRIAADLVAARLCRFN